MNYNIVCNVYIIYGCTSHYNRVYNIYSYYFYTSWRLSCITKTLHTNTIRSLKYLLEHYTYILRKNLCLNIL